MKKVTPNKYGIPKVKNYLKVPFFSFILLLFALSANAQTEGNRVSLSFKNQTLPSMLKEIKNQTKYDFMYNSQEIDIHKKISVELKNVSLDSALRVCLTPFGLNYTIKDKIIILKKKQDASPKSATQQIVNGQIKDKKGSTLPGVAVILEGSTLGTITDTEGKFRINLPAGENTLIFSFIGMKPVHRKVAGNQEIAITMEEDVAELDEVVVTGMETIKRDYMTGSASVITAKDLRTQGINSIDKILEGTIAGLNSTTLSGAPGTRAKITIRGENNLSGRTEPLWIVDGLPLMSGVPENNTGDYAGTIMQDGVGNIMPEDIESVTILKDASAAAIYGAKAANGVIVITTKKGFRSKTQFNYTGNYSLAEAPRLNMDFMNSREKLQYEQDIVKTFGTSYFR